jgi:hypothetical protein
MGQIKVRAVESQSHPIRLFAEIAIIDPSLRCRALRKHQNTENGASILSPQLWKKTEP